MKKIWEWVTEEIMAVLLITMILIITFFIWAEETDRIGNRCVKTTTVTEIISANYRTVTVMTLNGELNLNQPTIKKGDELCIEWEKFNKFIDKT